MAKHNLTALDRMLLGAVAEKQQLGNLDDPICTLYPVLFRCLTNTDAGPKHLKEPARLAIRATPGGWLVTLTDESLAVAIDASSPTLEGLWASLEGSLTCIAPAIRTWGRKGIKLKPKSKKQIEES